MKIIIKFFFIVFIFFSCEKETEFDLPLVFTGEVTGISENGATFSGKISNLSEADILEYGFVWDSKTKPTVENAQKYILKNTLESGTFNAVISTTLEEDVVYFVRAYIKNSTTVFYGNDVIFNSKGSIAPTIKEIIPKSANLKDTFRITGSNFSYKKEDNKVFLGKLSAKVFKATQDTLWAIVPSNLNQLFSPVKVSILNHATTATDSFKLIPPIIADSLINGTFGSEITINGDNFTSNQNSLKVFFNGAKTEILELNNKSIKIAIPAILNKREYTIQVEMNNLSDSTKFVLNDLEIDDFNPKKITTDQTFILYGNNFSPNIWNNVVMIGGVRANVISAEINKLEVQPASQKYFIYPSREVSVEVSVLGQTKTFNSTLQINDVWFRLQDSPFTPYEVNYVTDNENIYVIKEGNSSYIQTTLWRFDTRTEKWLQLSDFPGYSRRYTVSFIIKNKIYYGTGFIQNYNLKGSQKDFWEYDIISDEWRQKNDFPGGKRHDMTSFAINSKGYLVGGASYDNLTVRLGDCWEYSPENDSWVKMQDIIQSEDADKRGITNAIAVTKDNIAILGLGIIGLSPQDDDYEKMFLFNPEEAEQWRQIESFPEDYRYRDYLSLLWKGNPTFYTKETFFSYDVHSNSWIPQFTSNFINTDYDYKWAISTNEKIYFGLSGSQVWVYDPNRE